MRVIFKKIAACLAVMAFAGCLMGEAAYANTQQSCPCCLAKGSGNKCHSSKKCQHNSKACVCRHQPSQVSLLKSEAVPAPALAGFLAEHSDFSYLYLTARDIFHPPKSSSAFIG